MAGAWFAARARIRHRWRSGLLVIALVGLTGGVILTTVAGARRASTAYDRFREETLAADLDIAFDGPPGGDLDAAFERVSALPEVEQATRTAFPFIVPAGSGFYPYLDFLAVVGLDDAFGRAIERPRVLEGRPPNPDAAGEIAIIESYAREAGLELGDRVEYESFAPDQLEPLFTAGDAGPPAGPRVTLEVTGIFNAPTFLSESSGDFVPRAFLSRAFSDAHRDDIATYPGGFTVLLRDGAADVGPVSDRLRTMFEGTNLELTPAAEIDRKIEPSIDVIVTALLVCAAVAAIAGCVAIAQALARHVSSDASSEHVLAALGMTHRERLTSQVLGTVPVAFGGAVIAVLLAVGASPLMPVGVARRAEPDPGLSIDPLVLGLGAIAIVTVVFLLAATAALVVGVRERRSIRRVGASSDAGVMPALRRTSLRPPATIGIGMVLEPRSGTAAAVRSALVGVAFGTAGVVAVVVFAASVTTLVDSSERYGAPFDAMVAGFSGDVLEEEGDDLTAAPDIRRIGVLQTGLARVAGEEVNSHAFESLKGAIAPTVLDGRLPNGRGEVALGSLTSSSAGAGIGDTVEVDGAGDSLSATVVGTVAFPVVDERSSAGRGVLLVPADLERISSDEELNTDVVIDWESGVDVPAANARFAERTGTEVAPPRLPSDVNNLREVETLPRAIAVLLALLAALSTIHALATTVRMRRRDFAVLRTVGFEHGQLRSSVRWQATTIAVLGLVVGIPLGMVVGRAVWRTVASGIGVVDNPVIPDLAVVAVAVAAVLLVNVAAIVPGWRASRLSPAAVLRVG